ncbi:hypothetical protein QBC34DRAFT_492147 [Podospora aff. communis PSN243]|uniref:Uncharacterized protein n=1 Tax=Podospora aff. communis PSN243 TaxID=3040156 RepID=A0AAV9GZ63_9PEZI|nr:hypothetical protein QBC34DRAFT_492147 [Podospora aff. communis PSN243]
MSRSSHDTKQSGHKSSRHQTYTEDNFPGESSKQSSSSHKSSKDEHTSGGVMGTVEQFLAPWPKFTGDAHLSRSKKDKDGRPSIIKDGKVVKTPAIADRFIRGEKDKTKGRQSAFEPGDGRRRARDQSVASSSSRQSRRDDDMESVYSARSSPHFPQPAPQYPQPMPFQDMQHPMEAEDWGQQPYGNPARPQYQLQLDAQRVGIKNVAMAGYYQGNCVARPTAQPAPSHHPDQNPGWNNGAYDGESAAEEDYDDWDDGTSTASVDGSVASSYSRRSRASSRATSRYSRR